VEIPANRTETCSNQTAYELEDLNNLLADFVRIVRTKKEVVIATKYKKH
jgi:hypothetical protein